MAKLIKSRRLQKLQHGYTLVNNDIVYDEDLSLKNMGLLLRLLSLPEDWEFSIPGLASLSKDGAGSVRTGLQDLERMGYLVRARE